MHELVLPDINQGFTKINTYLVISFMVSFFLLFVEIINNGLEAGMTNFSCPINAL